MLKFTFPEEKDRDILKDICAHTHCGVQAFTYINLTDDISDGSFFCGKDEKGEIKSLVFNDSDKYIKVFGEEFSPLFTFSEDCIMEYPGKDVSPSEAVMINGKKIMDFYLLISESSKLSFDNEKRYVYRTRTINNGYGAVFAIYEDGKIVSAASVSAINEKYALISDVYTKPCCRKKGFASECIRACIKYCIDKNKTPFLCCKDSMCDYYRKLGFTYYGKM